MSIAPGIDWQGLSPVLSVGLEIDSYERSASTSRSQHHKCDPLFFAGEKQGSSTYTSKQECEQVRFLCVSSSSTYIHSLLILPLLLRARFLDSTDCKGDNKIRGISKTSSTDYHYNCWRFFDSFDNLFVSSCPVF